MRKRIGLFGGSFDPPHLAHLALARSARDELRLDELRWLLAAAPWQKAGRPVTPAAQREAMVRLAIAGEPRFVLERHELEVAGPSVTLHTVQALQAAEPGATWFLVIGADQHANLHTWRGFEELLDHVVLAVAQRPGPTPAVDPAVRRHRHRVLPLPLLPISSTEVRACAARGERVDALVPTAVADYIERHHLYREGKNA